MRPSLLCLFVLALVEQKSAMATRARAKIVTKGKYWTDARRGKEEEIVEGDEPSAAPIGTDAATTHAPTYASRLPTVATVDTDIAVTSSPKPSPSPAMLESISKQPTAKPTSPSPTSHSTVSRQTKLPTGAPTLSSTIAKQTQSPTAATVASLSPTTGEPPTFSPVAMQTSSPISTSSVTTPTGMPSSSPTLTVTSPPTSLRSKAPTNAPTQHPSVTQTTSPSIILISPSTTPHQTDVEGDIRFDIPQAKEKPPKEKEEDTISEDGGSLEPYSPGCASIKRGEVYTVGIPLPFDFKYQLMHDATKNFTLVVKSLEKNVQRYLEKALVHCYDYVQVISIDYFTIDGIHVDLTPKAPPEFCGMDEQSQAGTCAMLDGSITLYLSERVETSILKSKQDALRVLSIGMGEDGGEFLDEPEGIYGVSFLGGVGNIGGSDISMGNVPASARIVVLAQQQNDEKNKLSGLGVFLVFVAVATTLFFLVAIRRRRRKKRSRNRRKTVKEVSMPIIIEEEEEEEEKEEEKDSTQEKPDDGNVTIKGQSSVVKSFTDAFVASTSVFGLEKAKTATHDDDDKGDDNDDDDDDDDANSVVDDASLNTHSIPIHQYCTSPTCKICRSWKKPMFTDLKYNVKATRKESDDLNLTEETPVCPRGIVSNANCYLCSA